MSLNQVNSTADRPHVLCALCRSFWGRATCLSFTSKELSSSGERAPPMPQYLLHSHHRSEIKSAASSGCHFCSIMLGAVAGCTGDHAGRDFFNKDDPVYISIDILNKDEGTFLLTLFPCEQSEIFSHDLILNSFQLHLCPIKKNAPTAAPGDLQLSRFQTCTFSDAAASFIKSWILECQTTHIHCGDDLFDLLHGSTQPKVRPSRLLDLLAFQDPGRIQLIDSENATSMDYCALSYSWGRNTPYTMTSRNMADFKKEMLLRNLPRTLQDTIQVVRDIGFRYLWIDALCMMQDGSVSTVAFDDWVDQAGKMNEIFGSSVITIAASESVDGHQGFIRPRNPLSQTACRLDSDAKLAYEVVPPCTPYCVLHPFDKARYHLDTRAWVFQERILAPRTAHFTRNFIHLECRTELKCEAARADACHHSGCVGKADYQALFAFLGLGGLDDFTVEAFFSYWHEMIRRYSATNLSRDADLLVALAGLAKQVQKKMHMSLTWSFGLWREHLIRDMLWYVRGGKGIPSRERAPSWSWASIEVKGPQITYETSTDISFEAKITALPEISDFVRQPPLSGNESRYCVKVQGQLKAGAPDPISGEDDPLADAMKIKDDKTKDEKTYYIKYCQGKPKPHLDCPFHPDCELPKNIELFTLLLARVYGIPSKKENIQISNVEIGVVLTPVPGYKQRYKRVGYFHHTIYRDVNSGSRKWTPSLFSDECLTQEIEII